MKTLRYSIFILLAVLIYGCQTIPADQQLLPVDPSEIALKKNVLLLEFTGFRCVNCPLAAEQAHKLTETYPEHVVVVAMHPASSSFTHSTKPEYDYTCPEADVYFKHLGGNATTSFPAGSVAMGEFTYFTEWMGQIIREAVTLPAMDLTLSAKRTDRQVEATVTATNPQSGTANTRLLLWLVENDVLGAQFLPDGSADQKYVHQHMLRAELLSEDGWGKTLSLKGQQTVNHSFTLPEKVVPENCVLVAVLLDAETNKTVLNVKQIKL